MDEQQMSPQTDQVRDENQAEWSHCEGRLYVRMDLDEGFHFGRVKLHFFVVVFVIIVF